MEPAEFRARFACTSDVVYLNNASVSPLPVDAGDAIAAYVAELTRFGAARYPAYPATLLRRLREQGARLLGTRPERVFFVRSTSQGLGLAASGLRVRPGDNVVVYEREFPANMRPWSTLKRKGVEVRLVPASPDGRIDPFRFARLVDRRTRAVAISLVQFENGFRADLACYGEIARRSDALLVVDGIQGVGAFPVDVERDGVDVLVADGHKWMCGPEGAGLGYASERALNRIEPAVEGWLSVKRPYDFFDYDQPLKAGPARFEEGAHAMPGLAGLSGALALLEEVGQPTIMTRIFELTDHAVAGFRRAGYTVLSPRSVPAERSGILLVTKPGLDALAAVNALRERGIVVSARGAGIRLSPHAWNTEDEIDRLIAALGDSG